MKEIREKKGKAYVVFEEEVPLMEIRRMWERYQKDIANIDRNIQGLQRRREAVEARLVKLLPYLDEIQAMIDKESEERKPPKQGG